MAAKWPIPSSDRRLSVFALVCAAPDGQAPKDDAMSPLRAVSCVNLHPWESNTIPLRMPSIEGPSSDGLL